MIMGPGSKMNQLTDPLTEAETNFRFHSFTTPNCQVDSVKNQYEHFLSLLQAHCSMVRDPRKSDF